MWSVDPILNPDIGGKDLSQSARMAYSCAVLWYISREERYAEIVVDIIEKWANTLRSFDENNAKLLVALTGYEFCNAAEILRYNYSWVEKERYGKYDTIDDVGFLSDYSLLFFCCKR